jgi:hypothetical protein
VRQAYLGDKNLMTQKFLEYPLSNGYIHNWLVTGPELSSLQEVPQKIPEIGFQKEPGNQEKPEKDLKFHQMPVELGKYTFGGEELTWKYFRCSDDHLVHFTASIPTWSQMAAWAYVQIQSTEVRQFQVEVTTRTPISIWLNGECVLSHDKTNHDWESLSIPVTLQNQNDVFVCVSKSSVGESNLQFGLRLLDYSLPESTAQIKVKIPTKARFPHRYQLIEKILEHAYLENIVHYRGDHFNLRWNEEIKDEAYIDFQVQDSKGAFYVSGTTQVDPRNPYDVGHNFRLYERPFWVALMAVGKEYWEQDLRYTVRLPIHILDTKYSASPYGSPFQRRQDALTDASKHENNLFAMLARMELGRWDQVLPKTIETAIDRVSQQAVGSEVDVMGLLIIAYRFMENENYPAELKEPVIQCILDFCYSASDLSNGSLDFEQESSSILFHACEILAGQHFPTQSFTVSKQTGQFHRQRATASAEAWLTQRGQDGFSDWNSNSDWPTIFLALSQLASLADDENLCELATILLDKMLFLLATNSFKGSFAASHGRTAAGMLKSSQLEATSGVTRMLWGVGVFNHHILGTVGLALSDYEYPSFYYNLATEIPEESLQLEHHAIPQAKEVDLVTYKTPDYMLSSAQDFYPGQPGRAEHLWQATFSPEAVVFVNHPACSSEDSSYQPGFWLGNGRLPRIAQWKDILVSIFQLPENDQMGFTHAYFPQPAFDDFYFSDDWAFLQKGSGYLALAAANGLNFIRQGPNAYRELRSTGLQNVWVCQLGREAVDGSFAGFRKKILGLPLAWQPAGVRYTSLRGDEITFNWEGPLLIDGVEKSIKVAKHIDGPFGQAEFPASQMDINFGEFAMRLKF